MRKISLFLTLCCLLAVNVGCAPETKPAPAPGGGGAANPPQTPDAGGSVRK